MKYPPFYQKYIGNKRRTNKIGSINWIIVLANITPLFPESNHSIKSPRVKGRKRQ